VFRSRNAKTKPSFCHALGDCHSRHSSERSASISASITAERHFLAICHSSRSSLHNFTTRAGVPTAIARLGRSRVTTLLAPTMVHVPMFTPGRMTTFCPIQLPEPIRIGCGFVIP
jgi:hypothetical protein